MASNQEILYERRKQLENIHKEYQIIKDISDEFANKFEEHGAILGVDEEDIIEADIIKSEENSKKTRQEITKTNKLSKAIKKKMICLIIIIFVAVFINVTILLSLILWKIINKLIY